MSRHLHINPVHLEALVNGDASAGIAFKVFQRGTDITANITGNVGIVITDIDIVTQNAATVLLACNADADGQRIATGNVAANSGIVRTLATPHYCPLATLPKLFGAATGITRAVLHGYLYGG